MQKPALHLLRLIAGTEIVVGDTEIPVIVSLPAGLALAALLRQRS